MKVILITSVLEGPVLENIKRKESQAEEMANEMINQMRDFVRREVVQLSQVKTEYNPTCDFNLPAFIGV